jgi:RNA polymerase sigma-70 factor (ECF subfamily)
MNHRAPARRGQPALDPLTALAFAARHGDPQSMAEFIRASHSEVWSFCAHLVDRQAADDLAQETYLRVFRALPAFRQESSARTWLLSIARRVCADELRSRTQRRRRDEKLISLHEEECVADAAQRAETDELLSHLLPERRAAFVLTQLIGLSYEEAAQACHCPVGTVRSRVARARADLIEVLQAQERIRGTGVDHGQGERISCHDEKRKSKVSTKRRWRGN